jgi:hypothetical protein
MRSGVQGADNDRVLYWPLAIAIGCPVICILAWSDTFLVQLICGPFTPFVTFVSLIIDAAACKSGGVVCSLAWITGPFILAGLLSLIIGPLAFGVWLGAGVVVPLIAVMEGVERGFKHSWRRLLSIVILPLVSLVALYNVEFFWRAGHTAGDYVYLLARYPGYMAEVAQLPADEPRFKVWQRYFYGPCGTGIAYDESGALVFHTRWVTDERIGTVEVEYVSRAFGHFYFVLTC